MRFWDLNLLDSIVQVSIQGIKELVKVLEANCIVLEIYEIIEARIFDEFLKEAGLSGAWLTTDVEEAITT